MTIIKKRKKPKQDNNNEHDLEENGEKLSTNTDNPDPNNAKELPLTDAKQPNTLMQLLNNTMFTRILLL